MPHEDPEDGMSGNGSYCTQQSHMEPVLENVHYIFNGRKPQRHDDRVNDSVKAIVKSRVVPAAFFEEEVLAAFFDQGNTDKIVYKQHHYGVHS